MFLMLAIFDKLCLVQGSIADLLGLGRTFLDS